MRLGKRIEIEEKAVHETGSSNKKKSQPCKLSSYSLSTNFHLFLDIPKSVFKSKTSTDTTTLNLSQIAELLEILALGLRAGSMGLTMKLPIWKTEKKIMAPILPMKIHRNDFKKGKERFRKLFASVKRMSIKFPPYVEMLIRKIYESKYL